MNTSIHEHICKSKINDLDNKIKIKDMDIYIYIGESNRIRTVPEYGHSRYLRNHKSYKKMFNE